VPLLRFELAPCCQGRQRKGNNQGCGKEKFIHRSRSLVSAPFCGKHETAVSILIKPQNSGHPIYSADPLNTNRRYLMNRLLVATALIAAFSTPAFADVGKAKAEHHRSLSRQHDTYARPQAKDPFWTRGGYFSDYPYTQDSCE
jgi:hypothetical protein